VREAAHNGIQPAKPAGLAELLECGGNRYLTDTILRLNDKVQLACGPQFSAADAALLAAAMPALSAALAQRQPQRAEHLWTAYAQDRYCSAITARSRPTPIRRYSYPLQQHLSFSDVPHPTNLES